MISGQQSAMERRKEVNNFGFGQSKNEPHFTTKHSHSLVKPQNLVIFCTDQSLFTALIDYVLKFI